MSDPIEYLAPIPGAAEYKVVNTVLGYKILMCPPDGETPSVIDSGIKRYETAHKRAIKWQKKENAAVLKSNSK